MSFNMRRDTAKKQTGQCLMVATRLRVCRADCFVVGANTIAHARKGFIWRDAREIPKPGQQVRMMRPTRFGKRALLEVADKSFCLLNRCDHASTKAPTGSILNSPCLMQRRGKSL